MKLSTMMSALLFGFALIGFTGCRAKPAPDSGFLKDPKLMAKQDGIPFNRIYVNPKYRDKGYTEIYLAPVNTDYADQMDLGVKVVEKPTGSLSFGAGYSSRDGVMVICVWIQLNVQHRPLLNHWY